MRVVALSVIGLATLALGANAVTAREPDISLSQSALAGTSGGTADATTTVSWINPNGGDWSDPGNWDTGLLPTATQEAVIDIPVTNPVTYSTGTTQIKSLTSTQPLTFSGGTLDVDGSLHVDAMTSFTGGSVTTAGDQTYNGAVVLGADTLLLGNDITFNGTLNSDAAARSLTLNGNGTITFGGAVGSTGALSSLTGSAGGSITQLFTLAAGELTLNAGAGITLTGASADAAVLAADTGITVFSGSITSLTATNATSGDISVTGMTGPLDVVEVGVTNSAAGDVTLATTGALTLRANVTVQTGMTISLAGGMISQTGGEPIADTLHLSSVNGATLNDLVATNLSSINTGAGNIVLSVLSGVTIVGAGLSNSGGNVALDVSAGDFVQSANVNVSGTITLDTSGSITRAAGSFTAGTAILSAVDGISLSTGSITNLQALNTTSSDISILGMTGPMTITVTGVENQAGSVTLEVAGNVTNLGTLRLGAGHVTVTGDFVNTASGVVHLDIAGTGPAQFGRLVISGLAALDGTLDALLVNGFVPAPGDRFQFMTFDSRTGSFDTLNVPVQLALDQADPRDLELVTLPAGDITAPTVTITTPANGATYTQGQVVSAVYTCVDELGGSGLASCIADLSPIDTSTVGTHSFTVTGTDNAGNSGMVTNSYTVTYCFDGLFSPVDNLPVLNSVSAGRAIPVKFSLCGDQGLAIFAAGYPRSHQILCDSSAPVDGVEETLSAGSSSLSYDAVSDRYSYVWKTDKSWAGTCRQLALQLADGTFQHANFKFR